MVTDLTNNEKKIDIKIFKDMKSRVNKYIEQGGKPIDERRIYLDYDTKAEYVLYYKYKNMLVRYNAYVSKYNKEPTSLQISVNAGPIDDKNVKVPLETFLDMKARVDAFKGTLNDTTHVYLDMTTMYDYINYSTYKNMLKNYNTFVSKNKRQPNYITTTTKSCNTTIEIPNADCYKNPRYYSNGNMKQETLWYCSANMVQQILYELTGVYYSESYLAKKMGVTKSGTGPNEIVACVKNILQNSGYKIKTCEWKYFDDIGWNLLGKMCQDSKIGVGLHSVYKLKWGHYEAFYKLCLSKEKIYILNSLSGGYLEARSFSTMKSYMNAYSGKSILVVEVE